MNSDKVLKELKKWLRTKDILANSNIHPKAIKFKDILEYIEYLETENKYVK